MSDLIFLAAILFYVLLCSVIVLLAGRYSARARFALGDHHFRKAMDIWLSNGHLVDSAVVLEELQAEFKNVTSAKDTIEDHWLRGRRPSRSHFVATFRIAYRFCAGAKSFHKHVEAAITDAKIKRVQDSFIKLV